jgi:DNA modification methylase
MYVEHMVEVCREVKRVLKKTGSMYIVLGDTYQDKNLLGIPWRVAFALMEDGWILRNDIIWYKPNHMPSSVKDRLTQTYEHIFHFVKSRKYYYNLDNIREPHKTESIERWDRALRQKVDSNAKLRRKMLETTGVTVASMVPKWFEYTKHDLAVGRVGGFSYTDPLHEKAYNVKGKNPGDTIKVKRGKYKEAGIHSPGERDWYWSEQRNLPPKEEIYRYLVYWKEKSGLSLDDIKRSFHDDGDKVSHWFTRPDSEHGFAYPSKEDWVKLKELLGFDDKYDKAMTETFLVPVTDLGHPLGANPGDYWSISTKPFKGLHFAVYPVSICVRPILSSAPPDGVVLDPMCGSGTTCLAAQLINLKRWDLLGYEPNETAKSIDWRLKWIGIDINRSYVELARDRLKPYLVKTMLDYG